MRFAPLILALLPVLLGAQQPVASPPLATALSAGHKIPVPSVAAARRNGAIKLDAVLDESAWAAATPITNFTQYDPDEGKPASQRTEVRFLYDDDALYIGARMYDTEGAKGVTTRLIRRDGSFDSDYFEVVIDGYHDHLSRAFFDVNPSGSKGDNIGIGGSCCDPSWDPIWEAVTHIDAEGWTAEIRIPFGQLRFSRDSVQTWGLEVRRFIKRRNEQDDWATWHKNEAGGPPRFGHLTGLRIPRAASRLELLPYALSKSSTIAGTPGDPFNTRGRPDLRVGLDLKDRLTSNLTLDATINPDFGQVEVDPAVLNLSAFETFFPEKRPFFVEGAQVFDFGSFSCNFCSNGEGMSGFYSRRVGRAPTGAGLATRYAYADIPDATTILGAGKITGRTASGLTVGFLDAATGRSDARVATLNGVRSKQEVEPFANYLVGRVKKDFLDGNLVVGSIVSGVTRSIDSTFAPRLARHAEMYGNDLTLTWHDHGYSLRAFGGLTNVSGDPRAIAQREQSSARYFQRPDRATGTSSFLTNRFDTTASALRGAGAYVRVAKETGNWFGEVMTDTRSPGFETNDYSFQQRADYLSEISNVGRQWTTPGRGYRQIIAIAGVQATQNYEGDHTWFDVHQYVQTTTPQFWNVTLFHIGQFAKMDDRQLRGGPVVRVPANDFVSTNVATDSRRMLVGNINVGHSWDRQGSSGTTVSLGADYRPAPNVTLSFAPSLYNGWTAAQYVAAVSDTTARAFYGARYVMSNLKQRQLGLDTRASLVFSPTMTLELYVQPFFGSGQYRNFEEYVAPRQEGLSVYGRDRGTIAATVGKNGVVSQYTIDPDGSGASPSFKISNPDFSQQSLRGNAVFRWEYRPGSVLYVAWTQSREDASAFGDLDFRRDRAALLAARPDNIFLIKASWWLSR